MERRREQVLGLLWWAAMAGVSWLVLRYALVWLLPFLLALGAAALLEPLIVRAQRRLHLRRSFTAAVLTLVLVGGVLAVLIALAVQVVEQAVALVSSLPELLAALPETMASLERRLEGFCAACPDGVRQTAEHMLDSLPRRAAELAGQVSSAVLQGAGRAMAALPRVLLACGTTVLAVFFTLSAYPAVRGFFRRQLGSRLERARGVKSSVFATLGKWLKAECILLAVTFCQLLAGLLLMRQEYALLLAALIALIDALPVFGTGTVLVPWAAVECLLGAVPRGIALLALFAVISVVRSVLEPKLMAAQAGLPPLASLCAMYVGFCAMGVAGMVLAPMALMLVKQLRDGGYIRLWRELPPKKDSGIIPSVNKGKHACQRGFSALFALFTLAGTCPPASQKPKITRKSITDRCEAVLPVKTVFALVN